MQNLIFSLNATLPVFLVMVVGYALGQLGFLPPAFCKASDRLTFKVTLPLMLFLDMGSVDILHDFRPRFVLFCFAATLVGILTVWAGAKRFLKDKTLVGEFVQAGYRSSAAVLGVAFIQNIYGSAGMAPLMILGSVPLFNIFAVLILMLESPEQRGVPDPKQLLRGVATNPILLGIVFGTVYALLPFTLPQIATKTISSIASLTTPLSLLSIGASFEGTKAIKKLGPTLAAAFMKFLRYSKGKVQAHQLVKPQGKQTVKTIFHYIIRDLIFHNSCRGSGTLGIDKGKRTVILHFFYHFHRLQKIFFCFTREADNNIRCQRNIRKCRPKFSNQFQITFFCIMAVHFL